jgi:hypothetical protein
MKSPLISDDVIELGAHRFAGLGGHVCLRLLRALFNGEKKMEP